MNDEKPDHSEIGDFLQRHRAQVVRIVDGEKTPKDGPLAVEEFRDVAVLMAPGSTLVLVDADGTVRAFPWSRFYGLKATGPLADYMIATALTMTASLDKHLSALRRTAEPSGDDAR